MNRPTLLYLFGHITKMSSLSNHPKVYTESLSLTPFQYFLLTGKWLPRPVSPRYEQTRVPTNGIRAVVNTPRPAPGMLDYLIVNGK